MWRVPRNRMRPASVIVASAPQESPESVLRGGVPEARHDLELDVAQAVADEDGNDLTPGQYETYR